MGVPVTKWDMAETASGGPFPEVLQHEIFLNCILARPGCPVFVPAGAVSAPRTLTVIGDIACDPTSDFSPIKVYDRVTDWAEPALRVATDPVLAQKYPLKEVIVIDNASSDGTMEIVQRHALQDARLRFIANPDNPGFAVGCNQGARDTWSTWIALVNPDLMVEVDTLSRLRAHAAAIAGEALLGADLVDEDGVRDTAARRH